MSDLPAAVRGFVLQPTYRTLRGAPVVHLWGRLETGESFLVRDRRPVPAFWVPAASAERARAAGAAAVRSDDRRSLTGELLARVEVAVPSATPPLRDRLHREGIPTYEADVRYGIRYLIDRGVRGSLAIRGEARSAPGIDRVFDEPDIEPVDWAPELRVLSLDIETDPDARRILSLALHGCGAAEVLLVSPPGLSRPEGALCVADETELLERFRDRVAELDPDVLTGWNVVDFDFRVLMRRSEELRVPLALGRGRGTPRRRPSRGRQRWDAGSVTVPGRLVLDGLQLLRGAFVRMEEQSLDFVARQVLGEGKTFRGSHRAEEILDAFQNDRAALVEYNLTDARLVSEILEKLQLVRLAVERSRLTGLPPDRVASSIAAFDFLYLSELRRRKLVAPTVGSAPAAQREMGGGHVFEPVAGLYRNVLLLDFKSLYPSLIRTFQIDPLGYLGQIGEMSGAEPAQRDPIVAPNGAAFRREPGILPGLLEELFPRREAAIRAGDKVASHAIKILMNSFFGVLGTSACRFFNPDVADAITSFGRELLIWSRRHLEAGGHRVLYGDTDSLFVESGREEPEAAERLGRELVPELNRALAAHVAERWRVESRLEVELETLYRRLFLPPVRHGGRGARKRYAGLVIENGEPRVVFTGLEVVRRDWTELARRAQRELYERLFADRPVAEYLERLAADLRAGRLDDLLVYRKGLRKDPRDYVSTTPPHVAAARMMSEPPGRVVAYVVTTAGPEPAAERRSPLDYEHYLDRQLRPVAEPVLSLLGLAFDRVIGDDRQLDLF